MRKYLVKFYNIDDDCDKYLKFFLIEKDFEEMTIIEFFEFAKKIKAKMKSLSKSKFKVYFKTKEQERNKSKTPFIYPLFSDDFSVFN